MKNLQPLSIKQSFGLLFLALICAAIAFGFIKYLQSQPECEGICTQSITEKYNAIGHTTNRFLKDKSPNFTIDGKKVLLTKRALCQRNCDCRLIIKPRYAGQLKGK